MQQKHTNTEYITIATEVWVAATYVASKTVFWIVTYVLVHLEFCLIQLVSTCQYTLPRSMIGPVLTQRYNVANSVSTYGNISYIWVLNFNQHHRQWTVCLLDLKWMVDRCVGGREGISWPNVLGLVVFLQDEGGRSVQVCHPRADGAKDGPWSHGDVLRKWTKNVLAHFNL